MNKELKWQRDIDRLHSIGRIIKGVFFGGVILFVLLFLLSNGFMVIGPHLR